MNLGFLNDDSIFLKSTSWSELKKRIDKLLERHDRFIAKVEVQKLRTAAKAEAEQLNCINNLKKTPAKATIRQEYVKCGKSDCSRIKHGPYYHAYWKDDNGKLRKNYICKYPPLAKDNTNNVQKLHKINRNVINRKAKRPKMSVVQSSKIVLFIHFTTFLPIRTAL
jgi:Skp family chaperone for outer membrane proteins